MRQIFDMKKIKKKIKLKMPTDAVVAVTYRCNSRCIMCGIWKIKGHTELAPAEYLKLPKSLRDINISGGEPFLRRDLVKVIANIRKQCPRARIIISTNGFLVDVIKKVLPRIQKIAPKVELNVSIDGIGKMHEKIRGIEGGWLKVLETLIFAKKQLGSNRVKLAFTVSEKNYLDLMKVYDFAQDFGVGFSLAVAHTSDLYFGKTKNRFGAQVKKIKQELERLNTKFVQSKSPKNWARAYFADGLVNIVRGKKAPLPSYSGEDFFYLDPRGDIYPSVMDNMIMGNLKQIENFKEFWFSDQAQKARDKLKGYEVDYWMICTARSAIRRHKGQVFKWILKRKFKV